MSDKKTSNQKSTLPLLMIFGGVFLLAAAVIWAVRANNPAPVSTEPADTQTVERISVAEAWAAFQSGEAVFVDTRDADSFAEGHIPGALIIDSLNVQTRMAELDPGQQVITYCT